MTPKEFRKYLVRDKHCLHCGADGDELIPQHRANKGSGGSKLRDVPSNIIVFCSEANFMAEANAEFARLCRARGWKLSSWHEPSAEPVFDAVAGVWWLLDDKFGRVSVQV